MKQLELLRPGLDSTEVHRRVARFLPAFTREHGGVLSVMQAHLMSHVEAVNTRAADFPAALLGADLMQVVESAKELEAAIRTVSDLGVAVISQMSGYTNHDRLFAQYGRGSLVEGVDVLGLSGDAVTGVIVQPRHAAGDIFDPQINLRVRSDGDPVLSTRGEDGRFHHAAGPGQWYKFPLETVLIAGYGYQEPSQQR